MLRNKTVAFNDSLNQYLYDHSIAETPVLVRLREETYALGEPANMMSPPEAAQLLAFLMETIGAKNVLEIGVFTGYTTLRTALALPPGGRIVACDLNAEWTAIAKRYWTEAGVDDRIDLRLRPAMETISEQLALGNAGIFDLVFIDADKNNYDNYYEGGLKLLRPGGLMVIDNVLWSGKVIDLSDQSADTNAIRALNAKIAKDPRVTVSMLPVADGITLCRKL